jgi:tripartite-type tricarboxylate transporter receptor subunit TctC
MSLFLFKPVVRKVCFSLLSLMTCFIQVTANAQNAPWPATTKLVVPLPAGGGVDIVARKLGELLAPRLGTTVVVDNKAGASGLIGAKAAAAGAADGSTVFYIHPGIVTMQAITGRLDLLGEFKAVTKISSGPQLLVVNANSPYKTQVELFNAIKASPNKLNYGTGGNGSPTHLAFEWMDDRMVGGLKATQIPFKGSVDAVNALMGGDVDFTIALYSLVSEHIKSGKLRALSITSASRLGLAPNIPTVSEAGLPGYVFDSWGALVVPSKTPDALVAKLFDATKSAALSPEFGSFIERLGGSVSVSTSSAALTEQLRSAVADEKKIVDRLGLKPQ